jgi:hypothetical protein
MSERVTEFVKVLLVSPSFLRDATVSSEMYLRDIVGCAVVLDRLVSDLELAELKTGITAVLSGASSEHGG